MKPTIFIIEFYETADTSLCTQLTAIFPGYHFLEAQNEEEALSLALANGQPPDIFLIDINVLKISGIEVTNRIKNAFPETNFIVWTNNKNEILQTDMKKIGGSAYIYKHQLVNYLKRLLVPPTEKTLSQYF